MPYRMKKHSKTATRSIGTGTKSSNEPNCFLAVDVTKPGHVLASIEYREDLATGTLVLYLADGIKTFREIKAKPSPLAAEKQAYAWLLRYWAKWVSTPWGPSKVLRRGIGSDWPGKVREVYTGRKDPDRHAMVYIAMGGA